MLTPSPVHAAIHLGSSMAPKAKAKAKHRRAPSTAVSGSAARNDRQKKRREAVHLLNGLADEVGCEKVSVKSASATVEVLVGKLDPRCQDAGRPARLRSAVEAYLANGGTFSVPLLASPDGGDLAAEPCDDDGDAPAPVLRHRLLAPGFRLKSKAFMLTYNSRAFAEATWSKFLLWVRNKRQSLGARRWAACIELSEQAAAASDGMTKVFHLHAYLWWTDGQGIRRRNTDDLLFEGVRPRVDVCTCTAAKGRSLRVAAAHGLWYVAVLKSGTVFSETNFVAWRDYVPLAAWYRSLWDAHKLSNGAYAAYSRQLRSGHADRKRDIAELECDERREAASNHVAKAQARLKAAGVIKPARSFPEVDAFLECFRDETLCRRPILAIVGGSNLGKSLLAADILDRVGAALGFNKFLEVTVEHDSFLDLTDLDVRVHSGILLDGIGDVKVLKDAREVLQGRAKMCKAGRSPTMRFASLYTLSRKAVTATFDLGAANLRMFKTDHWLSNPKNVIMLHLAVEAWGAPIPPTEAAPPQRPEASMATWTADDVKDFVQSRDLSGPAAVLFASGVNGSDLLALDEDSLVKDVRLTPFAARKVLAARDGFLAGR